MKPSSTKASSPAFATSLLWLAFAAGTANFLLNSAAVILAKGYDFTSDYGITEWLINYKAGFIRRGLTGEILHQAWTRTGANPIHCAVTASIIIYAGYCIYIGTRSKGLIPALALPSALLLGAPLFTNNIIRKDVLLLLLFALLVHATPKQATPLRKAMLANGLLIAGMLIHEMFAFLALPTAFLCLGDNPSKLAAGRRPGIQEAAGIAPALIAFILLSQSFYTFDSAQAIHNSWRDLWNSTLPWPTQPDASIMWLNRSATSAIQMVIGKHASTFLGLPSFLWLAGNILLGLHLMTLCLGTGSPSSGSERPRDYADYFLLQLLSFSPLFIIAVDSGRWTIMALSSAFILLIESPFKPPPFTIQISKPIKHAAGRGRPLLRAVKVKSLTPLTLLFFGIPSTEWSAFGYLEATPIYQFWKLLRTLDLIPSLGHLVR